HDPDSFVRAYGAAALEDQFEGAQNLLEFAIQTRIAETHDLGIPDLIAKELMPWLLSVPDLIKRNFLAHKIAELTGIDAQQLEQVIRNDQSKKSAVVPKEATAPAPATPRAPVKPLKGPELEFIGHLYWSRPGEVDPDALMQVLASKLELEELWQEFALELLKALKRNLAPAEQNKAYWTASAAPETLAVIEHLERHAPAFATPMRQQQMLKLATEIRKRSLRETLSHLKQKLAKASAEEQQEILTAVTRITKELAAREPTP
ncbi:MAG: hypothetical protein ACOVS5_05935, partial [Oligoflexus sp.]